jgi:hypothetical protein
MLRGAVFWGAAFWGARTPPCAVALWQLLARRMPGLARRSRRPLLSPLLLQVGDRLDTDILFGQNGGLTTCLVLSGGRAAASAAAPAAASAAVSAAASAAAGSPSRCLAGAAALLRLPRRVHHSPPGQRPSQSRVQRTSAPAPT